MKLELSTKKCIKRESDNSRGPQTRKRWAEADEFFANDTEGVG